MNRIENVKALLLACFSAVAVAACGSAPANSADTLAPATVKPADLCEESAGGCGDDGDDGDDHGGGGDLFLECLDQYTDCTLACKSKFHGGLQSSCLSGCASLLQECMGD